MKRMLYFLMALVLVACSTSPTGRRQLLLLPEDQMDQLGVTAYAQMKEQQNVSDDSEKTAFVRCVADSITAALDQPRSWEVNVFADDAANAFALPGGKIGVNSGLLEVAENADQLAAVLGHEVGHVLARHSNERMSIEYATQTGLQLLQALSGESSAEKQQVFALLGIGSQVGITLPFSRKHESEADLIGLELMARAGFDPRASVRLWQNMGRASGGGAPLEFLSTHPGNQTRIDQLQANMDEAMQIYRQAKAAGRTPRCGG